MKKTGFLTVLVLFTLSGLFSQTLNLEQTRLLGLAASSSLAEYESSIRSNVLSERTALYNMLPQVSASYSLGANFYDGRNSEFVNPIDTLSGSASLSISQTIFNGGINQIRRKLSSITTETTRNSALAAYFTALNQIDNSYYTVLQSAATLESETSSLESANLNLQIAEIRMWNGIINEGDYIRALIDKDTRENSYNQARRTHSLNMTNFRNLTGITGNFELEQIDFGIYENALAYLAGISDEDAVILYDELWKIMAVSNPSLLNSALSNLRAENNHTITLRKYMPTVSVSFGMSLLEYTKADGFSGPSISSGSLSIRGSIPVDFWNYSIELENSRSSLENAARSYANAQTQQEVELQRVINSILAQSTSVLSTRRSLELTQRNNDIVTERFRLSQSSVLETIDASTQLINSRNSHINARYSFLRALSELRSLCALDDEEKLLSILAGNF